MILKRNVWSELRSCLRELEFGWWWKWEERNSWSWGGIYAHGRARVPSAFLVASTDLRRWRAVEGAVMWRYYRRRQAWLWTGQATPSSFTWPWGWGSGNIRGRDRASTSTVIGPIFKAIAQHPWWSTTCSPCWRTGVADSGRGCAESEPPSRIETFNGLGPFSGLLQSSGASPGPDTHSLRHLSSSTFSPSTPGADGISGHMWMQC